jgi:hypothetical protein
VVRRWYIRIAAVVGVVGYAVTLFLGAYLIVQGYPLQGALVLGLAACGLPLIIGWLRTQVRRRSNSKRP